MSKGIAYTRKWRQASLKRENNIKVKYSIKLNKWLRKYKLIMTIQNLEIKIMFYLRKTLKF
jgi:hypothetical protein